MPTGDDYWLALSVYAQLASVIVTLFAILVSLYIALRSNAELLSFSCKIWGLWEDYDTFQCIGFHVINKSSVPVHLESFGWKIGWISRGPKVLRFVHAMHNTAPLPESDRTPIELGPRKKMFERTLLAGFLGGLDIANPFSARVAFGIRIYPPIYAVVHTARGKAFSVRVSRELEVRLRAA